MKKHPVYIRVQIGKHMTVCLVDTGSEKFVLPGRLIDTTLLEPAEYRLFAANGTTINVIGEKTLNVHVGDLSILTRFVISSNVTEPMLGVNWLKSNRVIWDFAKDLLLVKGRKFELLVYHVKPCVGGWWPGHGRYSISCAITSDCAGADSDD